ncbi:MAG: bifunctional adenosylcobinamide hydrolase/alpha-ribazole phosphatase CbiS [Thermoproteota archaeon]
MKGANIQVSDNFIAVKFDKEVRCLSSAPFNGGLVKTRCLVNYKVPKDFKCENVKDEILKIIKKHNFPENSVVFLTAAQVKKYVSKEFKGSNFELIVISTVGLSNARSVGEIPNIESPSTINTFIIIDRMLTDSALVNAISTAAESKSFAMFSLDVRSITNKDIAVGTSTDAIAIASLGYGKGLDYAGTATEIGSAISKLVFECIRQGAINEIGNSLLRRLEDRGVDFKEIYKAAKNGVIGKVPANFKQRFKEKLLKYLEDPNVCSLLIASMRLEDEAKRGNLPNLSIEEYENDSPRIILDEVLGEAIANYISGTKGINNFRYYDMIKPGIISKLPMFLDDALCGLIGGIMARIFEEENE